MTAATPQPHLTGNENAYHPVDETLTRVGRGPLVTEQDEELLDRMRTLMEVLNSGALVLLSRERDPGRYARQLGDLGWVMADIGNDVSTRADELRRATR